MSTNGNLATGGLLALSLAVGWFAGNLTSSPTPTKAATPVVVVKPAGPEGDSGTKITEVHLSDGTRCAVMDGPNGKSITCDWAGPKR